MKCGSSVWECPQCGQIPTGTHTRTRRPQRRRTSRSRVPCPDKCVWQKGHMHSDSSKLTTKNMRRLIENNPVTCYANHADLYWQATLQGFRSFLQRGFFSCLPFGIFFLDYIQTGTARQESRAASKWTKAVSN